MSDESQTTPTDQEAAPRVLLIGEAVNPEWVSVPLVGWSHAQALKKVANTFLITSVRNRSAILRAGWREGIDFIAIDSERVAKPIWRLSCLVQKLFRLGWTMKMALQVIPYYYFEQRVLAVLGARLANGEFDLVHRLTPLSPVVPSLFLARRCHKLGIPFLWGPINGGLPWPREFSSVRWQEGELLSLVRGCYRLLPGHNLTRKRATAIMVGSRATLDQIPGRFRDRCIYLPENAIDPMQFKLRAAVPGDGPLRVVFLGRLVPYKGADMLLESVAPLIRDGKILINIIGDGPERQRLEGMVADAGIGPGVHFDGWIKHDQLQEFLVRSHVLGFPSIREFGGGVVLEAMALGIPPVVIDYGGPSELVTPETGFLVPIGTRLQVITKLREVFRRLADDPSQLHLMGERARERIHALFTWDSKAKQTREVYRWALTGQSKPDFGMPLR